MKLVESSNVKELRKFALMMMWAIPLLFMVIFPWIFDSAVLWWSLLASVIAGALHLFYPKGIYPFYRIWMAIAFVIGWINTRVILALIFYIIIFPTGILLRIFGKLQYQSVVDQNKPSFWEAASDKLDEKDLERPF